MVPRKSGYGGTPHGWGGKWADVGGGAGEGERACVLEVLCILHFRLQSLRHFADEPPRSWAAICSEDPKQAAETLEAARKEWQILLGAEAMDRDFRLEKNNPLKLVFWRFNKAIRYLLMLIEMGQYEGAIGLLQKMLAGVEEKNVEDMHQHMRDLERGQRHITTSACARYAAVIQSGVLEGLQGHTVTVSDAEVFRTFKELRQHSLLPYLETTGYAKEVPQEWDQMLKQATWDSPNADSHVQCMSAWRWIVHWWTKELWQGGCRLEDGWAGSLLCFQAIYLDTKAGSYFIAIAPKKWGALVQPLDVDADTPTDLKFSRRPPFWFFVHKGNFADVIQERYVKVMRTDAREPVARRLVDEQSHVLAEPIRRHQVINQEQGLPAAAPPPCIAPPPHPAAPPPRDGPHRGGSGNSQSNPLPVLVPAPLDYI